MKSKSWCVQKRKKKSSEQQRSKEQHNNFLFLRKKSLNPLGLEKCRRGSSSQVCVGAVGDGRRDGDFNGGVGAMVHFGTRDNLRAQVVKMWTGSCRGKCVCSPAALITAPRRWDHTKSHSGDKSMCLRWLRDKYSSQQDYTMTPQLGLEERLEGWDTCQNKETFCLPFVWSKTTMVGLKVRHAHWLVLFWEVIEMPDCKWMNELLITGSNWHTNIISKMK